MEKAVFEFSGALKRNFRETRLEIEFEPPKTIEEILLELDYTPQDLTYLVFFQNRERVPADTSIQDGDLIKVIPPIGGG